MLIEAIDLILLGLLASVGVLLWEQHRQRDNMLAFKETLLELVDKHNELADAFNELEENVEELEEAVCGP